MALKIKLKPHERLIIGGAVVANGDSKCDLIIENEVPVLRDKDILREKEANTPSKRVYFAIQLMYVDNKDLVENTISTGRLLKIWWKPRRARRTSLQR